EAERYEALAHPGSDAPDVIPPFDRTKDRPPPGSTGKLFHAGESGARSRWNNMRSSLASELWEGKVESIAGRAYGRDFELAGVRGRSDDELVITRPHGEGVYVYRVRQRIANMPAEFQFAIMDAVERTELPELMAMLVFCFDNGLHEHAGRMAARVKAAAPDLHDALDTYLAAKWKAEIPEGGF